jgi:TonB family protein
MNVPTMQRAAVYSLVAHVVFLTLAIVLSRNIPKSKPVTYIVKLVEQGPEKRASKPRAQRVIPKKQVLPEKPQNRQKVVPKPPKPENRQKVAPKKESKPAPKSAGPSIEDRIKELQRKKEREEQAKAQAEREETLQNSLERIRQQAAQRDAAAQEATNKAEYDRLLGEYQNTVMYAIYEEWVYPDVVDVKKLHAEISITVRADGSIKMNRFERPSGNRPFDRSCLKAITDAGNVPPPPFGKPIEFIVRFIPE